MVAFTCMVTSLSWACEPSQLALSQLRRSPSPVSGVNPRGFVKYRGWHGALAVIVVVVIVAIALAVAALRNAR